MISYRPGRSPASVKLPSAADVASCVKPLWTSRAVTLAPGSTPLASVTVP